MAKYFQITAKLKGADDGTPYRHLRTVAKLLNALPEFENVKILILSEEEIEKGDRDGYLR